MTADLFPDLHVGQRDRLGPGAIVLRGYALARAETLLADLAAIEQQAAFRHMETPGGFTMSVALTNCGRYGWTSDRQGYRYTRTDPANGREWPSMPASFSELAHEAATEAGFPGFQPDACLVNRYVPGARLALHQDKNERDASAPIVSVSLGMSATFLFGGLLRSDPTARITLLHGDVVVWGGPDRMRYHGILPLKGDPHPLLGAQRLNFTLRKAA
ncbi:DNA oxidative demethylase AlkB [Kerstersia gyiorum]|uniref:DNA oxidative demethylase AlkB n=1 Tax=Kerstersia gyiorum TaxID=206506 RepID=UPI00214FCDAF|nr:DNA oxidative demethylase AlkB [Kerstersia gyiorum]MCR4159016.1 DNA oxidative demethylase AlkB [Kerstersia gyiorum]